VPRSWHYFPEAVVETNDIGPAEKLAILQAWEADEQALTKAWAEGCTRIFTRCKLPSNHLVSDRCNGAGTPVVIWSAGRLLGVSGATKPHLNLLCS
jgi:hypothetical protein